MTRASRPIKGVPAPAMAGRLGPSIDQRRGVDYRDLQAADLVNRCANPALPFGWTLNPYRGCEMGCHYCFARYTHEFLGFTDPLSFERTIYVKRTDSGTLLAGLRRARRSGMLVAMGTATDPYQPAEATYRIARAVLEAARQVPGLRLGITTKSALVARDVDLLSEIAGRSEVTVNFSVTTLDATLARRLEPRAPRPDRRLDALRTLAAAGVVTRLFIMPILPMITDGADNLRGVLAAAREAGAAGAESNVLFLKLGTRETFFGFLRGEFPRLVGAYEHLYAGSAYASRGYVERLEARVAALAGEVGLPWRRRADRPKARRVEQLSLAW
ncbi:MAG: radical SAM protein [Candidatus Rokuibacteriota bacterium]